MNRSVLPRLSVMMLLQYMVWGAWLPVAARYLSAPTAEGGLGFDGDQIGLILGLAGSIGAIAAPFVAGQMADRYFRAERFLAFLLVLGGAIQWVTSTQTDFQPWLWLSIAYSVVYMPTLALSNSIAFAHMNDPDGQFGRVRVWGTLGWIVASWAFPMIWLQTDLQFSAMPPFFVGTEVADVTARLAYALKFSAILSFVYAAFCFLLPATPPKKQVESIAAAKAFALLRRPSVFWLVLVGLGVSMIHQVYFLQTGPYFSSLGIKDSQIGPAMSIGQFSEIAIMAVLGWMLKGLGFRTVLTIGAGAYFARYGVWSMEELPVAVLVGSQLLHGVCYACFFAVAYIYIDRIATEDVRHSAQTVFGIIMLGGGPVLGGKLSGVLQARYTSADGVVDFGQLWLVLSMIGLLAFVCVGLFFRDETIGERDA